MKSFRELLKSATRDDDNISHPSWLSGLCFHIDDGDEIKYDIVIENDMEIDCADL